MNTECFALGLLCRNAPPSEEDEGRGRRGTCGEAVEDSSSSPDIRLNIAVSANAREREEESHRCAHKVRNTYVFMCSFLVDRKVCAVQTWTASQTRPVDARESEGPHPGVYAGVRLGEAQQPGPAQYARDVTCGHRVERTFINEAGDIVRTQQHAECATRTSWTSR